MSELDILARMRPRQIAVLEQLSHGKTNKEIARALGLSERTVKNRMSGIFQILEVRNRTEAILKWNREGKAAIAPSA